MGAEAAPEFTVVVAVEDEVGTGIVEKVFGSPGAAVVTPAAWEVTPCGETEIG